MKLVLLLCVCALAAAEQPHHPAQPSPAQLTGVLANLYRRFLYETHPKQLKLQDALHIKRTTDGYLVGPAFHSSHNATFDGVERTAFSFISVVMSPGQAGYLGDGRWEKNDVTDAVHAYHYGGASKIHMFTEDGVYKTAVLGNPLEHKDAKFLVFVPKATYKLLESLTDDKATFYSYIDTPAWSKVNNREFSPAEMAAIFPEHAEMFYHLAKPGHH